MWVKLGEDRINLNSLAHYCMDWDGYGDTHCIQLFYHGTSDVLRVGYGTQSEVMMRLGCLDALCDIQD